MNINVLVVKKAEENQYLIDLVSTWKKKMEEQTIYQFVIDTFQNETQFMEKLSKGYFQKYHIIFSPFTSKEDEFHAMDRLLFHTVIYRVFEGEQTFQTQYGRGILYPKFIKDMPFIVKRTMEQIEQIITGRNYMEQLDSHGEIEEYNLNDEQGLGYLEQYSMFQQPHDDLTINNVVQDSHTMDSSKNVHDTFENPLPSIETNTTIIESIFENKNEQPNHSPFLYKRTRTIQKQLFAKQLWDKHKTIGIWSPIHQKGVTTFTMNFALFLGEKRLFVGVLEGLRKEATLKYWLNRYTAVPDKWESFSKTIHSEIEPICSYWSYRNVLFLPLDDNDSVLHWNSETLELYMKTPNLLDVTLVDFPTGEMENYTLDSLIYLDELWILVDDTFQEYLGWKEYIHILQSKFNVKVKLIFNQTYPFSQADRLAKHLDLELIAKLPAMHEEVMKNYYSTTPLLNDQNVREKITEEYTKLAQYLLGEQYNYYLPIENNGLTMKWKKLAKNLRSWLNARRMT